MRSFVLYFAVVSVLFCMPLSAQVRKRCNRCSGSASCHHCDGDGILEACTACNGTGKERVINMSSDVDDFTSCSYCSGSGKKRCSFCRSTGICRYCSRGYVSSQGTKPTETFGSSSNPVDLGIGNIDVNSAMSQQAQSNRANVLIWNLEETRVDGELGIKIHSRITIAGGKGETFYANCYFYNKHSRQLRDKNGSFRDDNGGVSTYTDLVPTYPDTEWKDFVLFIPKSELHLPSGSTHRIACEMKIHTKAGVALATSNLYGFSVSFAKETVPTIDVDPWLQLTDVTGKYSVQAKLIELEYDSAKLKKKSGSEIVVGLSKLNSASQKKLRELVLLRMRKLFN